MKIIQRNERINNFFFSNIFENIVYIFFFSFSKSKYLSRVTTSSDRIIFLYVEIRTGSSAIISSMVNYLVTREIYLLVGSHEFVFSLLIFMDFGEGRGRGVKVFIHDDWANYRWRSIVPRERSNNRINNG